MPKTLQISATNARKNFFNLVDMVSKDNVQVRITKKGLKGNVVLKETLLNMNYLQSQTYNALEIPPGY